MDMVTIENLKKYFGSDSCQVRALDEVTLSLEKGKFTAVIGASGSGKTTLLHIIGGLHRPTEGTVIVDGVHLSSLSQDELTIFRRRKVGFVFQDYNLISNLFQSWYGCWGWNKSWINTLTCFPAAASSAPLLQGP